MSKHLSEAPESKEAINSFKKKMPAPSGPPPAAIKNIKKPPRNRPNDDYDENDQEFDENDTSYDVREVSKNRKLVAKLNLNDDDNEYVDPPLSSRGKSKSYSFDVNNAEERKPRNEYNDRNRNDEDFNNNRPTSSRPKSKPNTFEDRHDFIDNNPMRNSEDFNNNRPISSKSKGRRTNSFDEREEKNTRNYEREERNKNYDEDDRPSSSASRTSTAGKQNSSEHYDRDRGATKNKYSDPYEQDFREETEQRRVRNSNEGTSPSSQEYKTDDRSPRNKNNVRDPNPNGRRGDGEEVEGKVLNKSEPKTSPKEQKAKTGDKKSKSDKLANVFNYQPILKATYRELRSFVFAPCPANMIIRSYIERDRSGTNFLTPQFSLCADMEDGTGRELIVCRKIFRSRTPHYVFSLKNEDLLKRSEDRSKLYLGKLRGVSATEYVMYERLMEDDDLDYRQLDENDEKKHRELVAVIFNSKKRPCEPGAVGSEACLARPADPVEAGDDKDDRPAPAYRSDVLESFHRLRITEGNRQNESFLKNFVILQEKTSRYDPLSSCLVDFRGRANIASIKNFQLLDSQSPTCSISPKDGSLETDREFILQLGKTADECYNLDFKAPLSMVQAFALCIARFDSGCTWNT